MSKKEVVLFKSEEKRDRANVTAFLHQLVDKIGAGQVTLRQGDQDITVDIPNQIVLEIKVEEESRKGGVKMSLEIELEWIPGQDDGGAVTLG